MIFIMLQLRFLEPQLPRVTTSTRILLASLRMYSRSDVSVYAPSVCIYVRTYMCIHVCMYVCIITRKHLGSRILPHAVLLKVNDNTLVKLKIMIIIIIIYI